jgi:RNA polymerase sigma-70 factor, ECF subfamily
MVLKNEKTTLRTFNQRYGWTKALEPTSELLDDCRSGNADAFKTLYRMYRNYALNIIYKITGVEGEHEDLLQEAFFQIFLSLKSFDGNSLFKTWFHSLVTKVCFSRIKHQNAQKRISSKSIVFLGENIGEILDIPDSTQNNFESRDLMEKAFSTLDRKMRIALYLFVYGELNIAEIAIVMRIPVGTVKSRLFHAKEKVKSYLTDIDR